MDYPAEPMITSHFMATEQILALLIQERDRLNTALAALQGPAKRGRVGRASSRCTGQKETSLLCRAARRCG